MNYYRVLNSSIDCNETAKVVVVISYGIVCSVIVIRHRQICEPVFWRIVVNSYFWPLDPYYCVYLSFVIQIPLSFISVHLPFHSLDSRYSHVFIECRTCIIMLNIYMYTSRALPMTRRQVLLCRAQEMTKRCVSLCGGILCLTVLHGSMTALFLLPLSRLSSNWHMRTMTSRFCTFDVSNSFDSSQLQAIWVIHCLIRLVNSLLCNRKYLLTSEEMHFK